MTSTEIERPRRHRNGHRTEKERAAEELEVLRLKVLGLSDVEIGERMVMSLPTVKKRLETAVERHGGTSVAAYREVIAQRYELLIHQALRIADEGGGLPALTVAADITNKYEKLLGVTAPQQVQMEVTQVTEQEKELRDMLAQAGRDEKARETVIIEGEAVDA